ncbi:hypothetical protein [Thalassovita aquimarina]|uniref:Uncharacterized protein n=1 Tax=Thalassovita aquimarina TaxID=2785917 RepID=A0ABS5HWV8_9RHOB|nr:hypothetical protein [Thalassovita aquimarina]MBR9653449.1 hypothetical protein [Thalassovita aquimarina]
MAEKKILELIEKLEAEIEAADDSDREDMQVQLHAVVAQMKDKGLKVPQRLSQLDHQLEDEAVESMFDNMPV